MSPTGTPPPDLCPAPCREAAGVPEVWDAEGLGDVAGVVHVAVDVSQARTNCCRLPEKMDLPVSIFSSMAKLRDIIF